jgi:hypothetical protein
MRQYNSAIDANAKCDYLCEIKGSAFKKKKFQKKNFRKKTASVYLRYWYKLTNTDAADCLCEIKGRASRGQQPQ